MQSIARCKVIAVNKSFSQFAWLGSDVDFSFRSHPRQNARFHTIRTRSIATAARVSLRELEQHQTETQTTTTTSTTNKKMAQYFFFIRLDFHRHRWLLPVMSMPSSALPIARVFVCILCFFYWLPCFVYARTHTQQTHGAFFSVHSNELC